MDKQLAQSKNKYGYYHGRFQPFHNGHLKVVKAMLAEHRQIILGISNPFRAPAVFNDNEKQELKDDVNNETRAPKNNPWTYWQRLLMIRKSLQDEHIDLDRVIIIPNLRFSHYDLNEVNFPKEQCVIWIMPSQIHNQIILDNYRQDGWEVRIIKKEERVTSGTKIRNFIRANNPEWEKYVPKGIAEIIKKYPIN